VKSLTTLTAIVALAACLASCSEKLADYQTVWNRTNYAGVLELGRSVLRLPDSSVTSDKATATFNSPDSLGVYAGAVTLNDVAMRLVPVSNVTQAGDTVVGVSYRLQSDSEHVPLEFGRMLQTFRAPGGSRFQPVTASIVAPLHELAIALPRAGDTITASKGMTISWNRGEDSATSIVIDLTPVSVPSLAIHIASDGNGRPLADSGTHTLPATAIAGFPPGQAVLMVRRTKTRELTESDGRRYMIDFYSEVVMLLMLAP
jgi:hypothetical protein